jgi:SNF2 family DNA or RNA helicase
MEYRTTTTTTTTTTTSSEPIVSVANDLNKKWTRDNAFFIPDPKNIEADPHGVFARMIDTPSKIKVPLMEHQKFAVSYCLAMESTSSFVAPGTNYTILTDKALYCDPVGAGKSLVMLSLISEQPIVHTKPQMGLCCTSGISVFSQQNGKEICPVTLLVVPNTLFTQWKGYIETQTTLKFAFLGKKTDFIKCDFRGLDGVLVNCNFYNDVAEMFKTLTVSRIIYDEVHMMKIPNSSTISSSFYWFISASPCEIERFTGRKHGFLPHALKGILSITPKCGVIFRNEQANIDMSIHLPKPTITTLKVRMSNMLNVLNGIVPNNVLEAIAAGDTKAAIEQLSLEKTDEDNIINVVNKHLQQELESHQQELQAKMIRVYSSAKAKSDALKLVEDKITETKKKIQEVKDRILQDNVDPITYDEIVTPVVSKCCQNKFDFSSLTSWLLRSKQACPMCRAPMKPTDLVLLHDKKDKEDAPSPKSATTVDGLFENKEQAMEKLLSKMKNREPRLGQGPSGAKILVSSGPTGNFLELMKVANKLKLTVRQLTGNIQTKNKILDDFRTGKLDILYLPAYESGSGLNLTEVTDMVLYHKMPNGIEDQVIGRCQRLGRTFPLNIWKVYYENEL